MKFRAIFASILVVIGIGVFWFCRQPSSSVSVAANKMTDSGIASVAVPAVTSVSTVDDQSLSSTNQTLTVRGTLPFVVKSESPINKPVRLELEAMGARMVGIRSRNALLVEMDAAARSRLSADSRFTVSEFLPSKKLSRALMKLLASEAKFVEVAIVSLAAADRESVRSLVLAAGGEILTGVIEGDDMFKARLPADAVGMLAGRGEVRWIEHFERPHLYNDVAVNPAAMNVRPVWLSEDNPDGLSGAGQIITTSDSGIDTGDGETIHEDLRDRVIGFQVVEEALSYDKNGHGTHTAGSIVGNGLLSDGKVRGTAWGARLWAWFCSVGIDGRGVKTPSTSQELFRPSALTEGTAYIHSASWGSDNGGNYSTDCQAHDTFVWEHPDFLPVFAAGNAGRDGARTVGSPAAAKNVLTVGATKNLSSGDPSVTASFSSRGPCTDGRIKPDVASPGDAVKSTRSSKSSGSGYYTSMSGTSMATPLTAGSVALIREWLLRRDEFSDDDPAKLPTAALMKAIITGGAKDVSVPNNDKGWGRTDIQETLYPTNRAVKLVDRIPFEQGTNFTYIVVTTNAAPLDVQLVWIDYPGDFFQEEDLPQLVNDLDLVVEPADGVDDKWYGNGGKEPDTLNNVESVRIADAAPNTYIISVNCSHVQYDHTSGGAAALYIRGAFDPEAEPEDPVFVRNRERNLGYRLLSDALKAVDTNETLEIVRPFKVNEPLAVGVSCTITTTNDDPIATAIGVGTDFGLTVSNGVRLLLKNVVFAGDDVTVNVATGGCLAVAGKLGLDKVVMSDSTGFELADEIFPTDGPLVIDCPAAQFRDQQFGVASCNQPAAEACRLRLVNRYDDELGAVVLSGTDMLVWDRVADPATAVAKYSEPYAGGRPGESYYNSLATLFKDCTNNAVVTVLRNTHFGTPVTIDKSVLLVGANDITITNSSALASLMVTTGGTVVVSNLVFRGFSGPKFMEANGGTLILERGTVLYDISMTDKLGYDKQGPVTVRGDGCFVMRSGAVIRNCTSLENGGAVCAFSGVVNLEGGQITGCGAGGFGGGVFAEGGADFRLSGDIYVRGNWVNKDDPQDQDIYCKYARGKRPRVVGPLTGQIGIAPWFGDDGAVIATYDPASPDVAAIEASASAFYSTKIYGTEDPRLIAYAENGSFKWKTQPIWTEDPYDPTVAARVIEAGGAMKGYTSVELAFRNATPGCTIELVSDQPVVDKLEVTTSVLLRPAPAAGRLTLTRTGDDFLSVIAGGSLTITNVCLDGAWRPSIKPLVDVASGSLTLESDTLVTRVTNDLSVAEARCASGIVVNKGVLTMNRGVRIENCRNDSVDATQKGTGGGILLDGSIAYFLGGTVTGCSAASGGGVAIANKSTAYASGDFTVDGNFRCYDGALNNIVVEDLSYLWLVDPLDDGVKLRRVCGYRADTNLAACVTNWLERWATPDALAADAAKFWSDDYLGVRGYAVTNATANALVVWGSSIAADGSFTAEDGTVYHIIGELPPPPTPVEVQPKPIAFKAIDVQPIVGDEELVTLVVTDAVQWCNYALFATNSLEGGFAITNAAGDYLVEPATNFQWIFDNPEIKLTIPVSGAQRFWKAVAAPGTPASE